MTENPKGRMRFSGKAVLVTGGGSGIGRAVASAFAREGAHVVVGGRRSEPLAQTVKLIEHDGGRASLVTADVSSPADVARLVDEVVSRCGGLDVAVNNAGILTASGPLADVDESEWTQLLAVNVTGVWLAMKYEIQQMRRNGGGAIVNVASIFGAHKVVPGFGAYAATKAAVSTLTRAAALECIADGIRINAVSPGPFDTAMSLRPGETEADRDARLREQVPVGRVGSLDEIASAILWLASPESGYAVGTDLVYDGGGSL
ncbi:MAG TPA: glucose 1-dehydrogenase [Actinopolymorphaceae bacterium]|jgi:NAD(P)-dependent dehydrogenase (short-subunit alcohol dehydrogenase family)